MPFHPLLTDKPRPQQMNNPFCYEPHPLCMEAAVEVQRFLNRHPEWADEIQSGKMFGVLVCEDGEGQLGFLAAYSGQIGGREDWPWFVPAVFDYLQPDGYFKQEEARISAINRQVMDLEASPRRMGLKDEVLLLRSQANAEIEAYKVMMQTAKAHRDEQRATAGETAEMIRQSQFQKAELHRLKQRWHEQASEAESRLKSFDDEVLLLKQERRQRSDALQRWLFNHFLMLNAEGRRRSLTDIFAATTQGMPPSGSGECCAPKLLQYAFAHRLRPLSIAEFWQGQSPRMEVRHHDTFYPACRGKCKPILDWMLPASPMSAVRPTAPINPVATTPDFLVINKPAGLLSVPGLSNEPSVESLLKAQHQEVYMVHRLDMDTSGLMVVALSQEAYHNLQRQFLEHGVEKEYVALLENDLQGSGTIDLPLGPDLHDRPRQIVDPEHGKPALTNYRSLGGRRVLLIPHTGRTHQLRVHCAHRQGLDNPILGDPLYGRLKAHRLFLHAQRLSFCDPVTGERLSFHLPAPF